MDASGSDERSSLPDAFCPSAGTFFERHLASPLFVGTPPNDESFG
jgi:hypothetical protein